MAEIEDVSLHIRLPQSTKTALLKERDRLRKDKPMATLSDAVRLVIDRGLSRKTAP